MKNSIRMLQKTIYRTDKFLLGIAVLLSGLSVTLLLGIAQMGIIGTRTVWVQVVAITLGICGAMVATIFDPETLVRMWKIYMPPTLFLMALTFFIGSKREGSTNQSWLKIAGVSIQPSEFLKIAFILSFALHLSKVREEINTPKHLFLLCVHGAFPVALVLLQKDDGVALIMASIIVVMLFVAGVNKKLIITGIAGVVVLIPIVWFGVLSEFQKQRFLVVWDKNPDPLGIAYQQLRGLTALGSGQLFGNGIFQDQHVYVPENYNDFIFTFLGESLGFVGCVCFLIVFSILCGRILQTAIQARSYVGKYICTGVFAMIVVQGVVNISMCLMIMPVIGVTLPLMSAGGSSVLATYAGLGIVMCVYADNHRNMFSDSKH